MENTVPFERGIFESVVGGRSAIDLQQLRIRNREEAHGFVKAYGYDFDRKEDVKKLQRIHLKAIAFIKEDLLLEDEEIPQVLTEMDERKDLEDLLLFASHPQDKELKKWACAVLRVMHVFVHMENDLFNIYSHEIQQQILRPIEDHVWKEPATGSVILGSAQKGDEIKLHRFDIKPFKTSSSTITKLLARSDRVALRPLDKLGVRFVTKTVYDSFRVIRFLCRQYIISFPHIMPDQSNNTLYPLGLFFEVMEELSQEPEKPENEINEILKNKLIQRGEDARFHKKHNDFSGKGYQFIKFINRKLIEIEGEDGQKGLSFFYPYEVQVVDHETYIKNLSGSSSHEEYKKRQAKAARHRMMFGLSESQKK